MERHQRDLVADLARLIEVGHEGEVLEEGGEVTVAMAALILGGDVDELLDVLRAGLLVGASAGPQPRKIAGLFGDELR